MTEAGCFKAARIVPLQPIVVMQAGGVRLVCGHSVVAILVKTELFLTATDPSPCGGIRPFRGFRSYPKHHQPQKSHEGRTKGGGSTKRIDSPIKRPGLGGQGQKTYALVNFEREQLNTKCVDDNADFVAFDRSDVATDQ